MRCSKGDGVKYIQSKGGSSAAIETRPLFPKLHINDTEKAGPRAPPRNKMALYEQFTVPSHGFVQSSSTPTASASTQQQIGPHDYGYPYVSYYMPPTMPYASMNYGVPLQTQASVGMSSCVTSSDSAMVCHQESQKTSKTLSAKQSASLGASQGVAKKGGSVTMMEQHKTEHKSQDMCMKNASRQQSPCKGDPQKLSKAGLGIQRQCNMSELVKLGQGEGPSTLHTSEELQQALSNEEAVLEGNDDKKLKGSSSNDGHSEQTDGISPAQFEQTLQLPHSPPDKILLHNDTSQADPSCHIRVSAEEHMATEERLSPCPPVGAFGKDKVRTTPKEELLGSFSWRNCGNKDDNITKKILVKSPVKSKCESVRQIKHKQTDVNNLSHPSQASPGEGGPQVSICHAGDAASAHDIRPRDVICAVGQQQFWKARKALLRQQLIFSDQVFQLHKLIKVQQLLAETPGTLIEDEMPFGAMQEDASSLHQSITEGEICPGGEEGNNGGSSFEARDEEEQGGIYAGYLGASDEHVGAGNGVGSTPPFMPTPGPGGISAWGYPSQGMGQWMAPVQYQPMAGAFHLGPPYGGFYGMPMPFGIPFNGQGNELREEVSSNHGPGAACRQLPSGQMATHTPNDVLHMWHCMQFSNPDHRRGFYDNDNGSCKGVPAGSVASINNQKALRAPSSRRQNPLGIASRSVGVDVNTREHSVYQDESSSPIVATKAQFKPFMRRPSYDHRDVEQLPQLSDTEDTRRPQGSMADRVVVGRIEADNGPEVSFKRHQVASTNGGVEEILVDQSPLDHSENVLDLFPRVPSVVNSGLRVSWKKQERLAEERHGRVIKAVPRPAVAASRSTAGILLSLQRERRR